MVQVVGVKRVAKFGIVAGYRYEDGTIEMAPTSLLQEKFPKELIAYYEKRVNFY